MLEKRIPTILALLILIAGVFGAVTLSSRRTDTRTKASSSPEVKEILLSNVSDTGFTISWLTDVEFAQYAVVPESTKKSFCQPEYSSTSGPCYYDDRDIETHVPGKNITHHVTIDGLSPNSKYTVKIYTSGVPDGKTFKDIENKSIATGQTISGNPSNKVIYGNFFQSDSKTPAKGALVYLISENGSLLSSLSKQSGAWLMPINKMRNTALDNYLNLDDNAPITLRVKLDINTITEFKTTMGLSQPLPNMDVVGGKTTDYTSGDNNLAPKPSQNLQPVKKSGFSIPTPNTIGGSIPLSITNPSNNSSVDDLPTFRGTAEPGQTVTIDIHSDQEISATVKTDENGNWYWTPPTNLTPGDHTATLTVVDKNGNRQTVTKTFTVLANANILPVTAGSQSAQISTPTPEPVIEEPTPETPSPTEEVIPIPTATNKVVNQEIPTTATSGPFIILLTSGMVFATMSLWLFFNRKRYY